ncbi:MAG: hypothetical protein PHI19_00230 [Clostridia bacterium]|jgi:hypothetical protein|nr:hypothetical protein [Clostridia bacterium]
MEAKKLNGNELAKAVALSVNSYNFDTNGFVETMSREHRTLQQSLTRLCMAWLYNCSRDDYEVDGRNQASHDIAKFIYDKAAEEDKSLWLPLV